MLNSFINTVDNKIIFNNSTIESNILEALKNISNINFKVDLIKYGSCWFTLDISSSNPDDMVNIKPEILNKILTSLIKLKDQILKFDCMTNAHVNITSTYDDTITIDNKFKPYLKLPFNIQYISLNYQTTDEGFLKFSFTGI